MATKRRPAGERIDVDNTDARAVRTRQKLVSAFHEAVRDGQPDDISVSALTRAAGVNRTSFYEHFASPEDLAIHVLSDLVDVVSNANIVRRAEHQVTAAEASRLALRDIVYFVHARRAEYAPILGPGASPRLAAKINEAFTLRTAQALRHMAHRPPEADPLITAQFLAAGVLDVIGSWLADPRTRWSRDRVVAALVQCLPNWIVEEHQPSER